MTSQKSEIIQNNKRPKFTPGELVVSTTDLLVVLVSDEQDDEGVSFSGTVVYASDLAANKYYTFVGQHLDSWTNDGFVAFNGSVKINS